MRPARRSFLLAALAGLVALASGQAGAQGQPPAPAVLVAPATLREVSRGQEFVGRIRAMDRVEIRARITGVLGARQFRDGDVVTEGQVIFLIDPAPFQATVDQRAAALAGAQATLRTATQQVERGRDLVSSRTIPQAQQDEREAAMLRAQADVQMAEAQLEQARIDLSYTRITSPIAGRISEASVSPGNLVGPSTGPLATVVRQDPVWVTFNVSQRQVIALRRGAQNTGEVVARLRLADGSTYEHPGRVDYLGVQADSATDTIPARAVFPNPDRLIADGMSVRIRIESAQPERVIVIPQSAIAVDQAGQYVLVVEDGNRAAIRRVRTETQRDGTAVVREGLREGERVIVQGQARVRPGMVVAPSPAQPPATPGRS